MPNRHDKIVQELDIQSLDGFSNAQKEYYKSIGFKPYLSVKGKVRWLNQDQHALRINSGRKRPLLHRLFLKKTAYIPRGRKHRSQFVRFIHHNWGFLLLVIVIAVAALVLMKYPQLLF